MAVWLPVQCPHCQSDDGVKFGKSSVGKQRYRCHNTECPRVTFSLNLAHPGRTRHVKQQIVDMSLNGSGIRDIARVLQVSPSTVIRELKKRLSTPARQPRAVKDVTAGSGGRRRDSSSRDRRSRY